MEVNVECVKFRNYDTIFATCEIHVHEIIDLSFLGTDINSGSVLCRYSRSRFSVI
jgi:hypothetical protein